MMEAQFCSITGTTPDVASIYLEMAGSCLDVAVSIYFDSTTSGGDAAAAVAAPLETSSTSADDDRPLEEMESKRGANRPHMSM